MARRALYKRSDWQRPVAGLPSSRLTSEPYRSEVRRDYARLIHSPAFRRLQGKTQLFPGHESDFFRNRLTHSLEVAQIAKSIATRLNHTEAFLRDRPIDLDLVEFAGLAHDIGHPPFGHNGEHALDRLMMENGGFEGNAQTLRLLARIEKKVTSEYPFKMGQPRAVDAGTHHDLRAGLDLTFRSLGAILKYDRPIPVTKQVRTASGLDKRPVKGYYELERDLVDRIKAAVGHRAGSKFKTVECQVMDIADDIAYSTYDLEDSLKADFMSPLMMISMSDAFKERIAEKVRGNIDDKYPDHSETSRAFGVGDVNAILADIFADLLRVDDKVAERLNEGVLMEEASFMLSSLAYDGSRELGRNGYLRTAFTSYLVGLFIRDVEFEGDGEYPSQSRVRLKLNTFMIVETLKHYSFQLLIESPRLKVAEKRGTEIIDKIFEKLNDDPMLLPDDWRHLYRSFDNDGRVQQRVVCDYMAGMTDGYCVELHSRITGANPPSLWKPH